MSAPGVSLISIFNCGTRDIHDVHMPRGILFVCDSTAAGTFLSQCTAAPHICNRSDWFSQNVKTTVIDVACIWIVVSNAIHFFFCRHRNPISSSRSVQAMLLDINQKRLALYTFHRSRCQSRVFDAACRFMPRPPEAGHFLVSSADASWRYINSPRRH